MMNDDVFFDKYTKMPFFYMPSDKNQFPNCFIDN